MVISRKKFDSFEIFTSNSFVLCSVLEVLASFRSSLYEVALCVLLMISFGHRRRVSHLGRTPKCPSARDLDFQRSNYLLLQTPVENKKHCKKPK